MSDPRPCGGDGYREVDLGPPWRQEPECSMCTNARNWKGGKCLGTDGYRWMALVASEVAVERNIRPSITGGMNTTTYGVTCLTDADVEVVG